MHLKKALEINLNFAGLINCIHIDNDGYFSLNDMCVFFPNRNVNEWLRNAQTKEYISLVEKDLNPEMGDSLNMGNSTYLKTQRFKPAIKTKRGRHGGGSYAHKLVAMKFAMWLSPEFELEVIKAYENGIERKESWDIQRVMAAHGYKFLTDSIKDNIVPKFVKDNRNTRYAYTTEADLINLIVFGKCACIAGGNQRENATEDELSIIEYLQQMDSGLIEAGLNYNQRKDKLTELYNRKYLKLLSN
jgi:hypothetical protein